LKFFQKCSEHWLTRLLFFQHFKIVHRKKHVLKVTIQTNFTQKQWTEVSPS